MHFSWPKKSVCVFFLHCENFSDPRTKLFGFMDFCLGMQTDTASVVSQLKPPGSNRKPRSRLRLRKGLVGKDFLPFLSWSNV